MTEPAREILHPQDEHETYCEMDEQGSKCEVSDRSLQVPAVREVYTVNGQVTPRLCKSTSSRVVQWGSTTLQAWSRTQQSVSLRSFEAELFAQTTGIAEGMVTKHLVSELGYSVALVNHVDSQAKACPYQGGLGRMKRILRKHMCAQDSVEQNHTYLMYINARWHQADPMTKCHGYGARLQGRAMLGMKLGT